MVQFDVVIRPRVPLSAVEGEVSSCHLYKLLVCNPKIVQSVFCFVFFWKNKGAYATIVYFGNENKTNYCMAHHLFLGLSMGRISVQPETDLTTSSGRAADHCQLSKTTGQVDFDLGE